MITVFTPAYNRAYRLPTLYQSLQYQTCTEFEWIIVDDGSQDSTKQLVEGWLLENNPFHIRYFFKENGGKHTAINVGVEKAKYDWFFIVDSDDHLRNDAVQKIHEWISSLDDEKIAAVSGTRCYPDGSTIGQCGVSLGSCLDVANNVRTKYHLNGDKAEVYRTTILKAYPFPVFPGERFLSESAVWNKIALDGYKIRWYNHPLIVCEYLADGLTSKLIGTDIEIRNFEGCTYTAKINIQAHTGIERIRIICQYINKGKSYGLSLDEIASRICLSKKLVELLSIPVYIKNIVKKRI